MSARKASAFRIAKQQIAENEHTNHHGCELEIMLDQAEYLRPALPEMIADENKGAHPKGRPAIGVQREGRILQLRSSRDDRREVAHPGNKIAHHERPMPDPVEP